MGIGSFYGIVVLAGMVGVIGGIMLCAYEDGKPFGLYRRLCCKVGKHRRKVKIGTVKVAKYFCPDCKKARKHPQLQVLNGGTRSQISKNKFDL
jgi:hypothetical protein